MTDNCIMIGHRFLLYNIVGIWGLALTAVPVPADSESPLVDAAENEKPAEVARLLSAGVSPNQTQPDGMTALHWAVYFEDSKLAKLLIDAGADATKTNLYGVTPLSLAAMNGDHQSVKLLLDAGADANTELPGGETALHTACRTGKLAAVRELLKRGAKVDAEERAGQTPIMWAAAEGYTQVVSALIDAGADFQKTLPSGFTPLLFAVRAGHIETTNALIEAGADVKKAMRPERNVAKGVRSGTSALILAVENGHFDLAVELLKAGADPNDERTGYTPLHTLSWVRKPNRGDGEDGDPPPTGSGRRTALDFVRELVKHGADVNRQLKNGRSRGGRVSHRGATPFFMVADTADLPLMKLLVELGANPKTPNRDGCTPLMVAAGVGTYAPGEEAGTEDEALAAVEYLLELGCDINAVDKNGNTTMHGAAFKSLPKMVAYLDKHGADIKIWHTKNKQGWTPSIIAQGHRFGNFKPSAKTIAALETVMRSHGVTPPKAPERKKREGYQN